MKKVLIYDTTLRDGAQTEGISYSLHDKINITKRLDDVATKRNEIIHSSWLAYSTGDYGQHRARPKGKKTAGLHKHKENPEKKMSELIYEIDEVLFDLICFEDLIIKGNSEQQH